MGKPIVVGIDDQPDSETVLSWAITEASRRRVPLLVLHAGEVPPVRTGRGGPLLAQRQTAGVALVDKAVAVVQAADKDLHVSSVIVPGDPADALISWSDDALMLVLGRRKGSPGVCTVRGVVAAQARCPVVVVRPRTSAALPVVVGVDGSPGTSAAIEFAFDHAARHRTWVRAVHTWYRSLLPHDITDERAAHHKIVTDAVDAAQRRHPTVPVRTHRPIGRAQDVLCEQSAGAQLVVVGTRGHSGVAGLLLGSVSQALLRTAHCPVAVIPPAP